MIIRLFKNSKYLVFLIIHLFLSLSALSETPSCLLYKVEGKNDFGSYVASITEFPNGEIVWNASYKEKWKNEYGVEELWFGKKYDNFAEFKVRSHSFLSQVGSNKLSKEQFQARETVIIDLMDPSKITKPISIKCKFDDTWNDKREKKLITAGMSNPFLVNLAKFIAIDSVVDWYQKQPLLDPYRDNQDFKSKNFYSITDLTDESFYQKEKKVLRLRNLKPNSFSLMEAQLKNLSLSFSLKEKAEIVDDQTFQSNINEIGLFQLKQDQVDIPDGDSALWTSMYFVALVNKYLVTKDVKTYQRAIKVLNGILLLLKISENSEEFARGIMPYKTTTPFNERWIRGSPPYNHLYWLPGSNNDMIKGLILTFAWSTKFISPKDPLFQELKWAVKKLKSVKLKRLNGLNQAYIEGLDAIYNNSEEGYYQFIKKYLSNQNALELLGLNRQFYIHGVADWSGINLAMVSANAFYIIAEAIEKKWSMLPPIFWPADGFPDYTRDATWVKVQQQKTIKELAKMFVGAKRDFLCLMNHSLNSKELGPAPESCFASLKETPAYIPDEALAFDYRLKEDFIFSSMPDLPWKSIPNRQPAEQHLLPNVLYPKYEGESFTSQMMWKEGFSYMDFKPEKFRVPRVDYLFSYWSYQYFQNR